MSQTMIDRIREAEARADQIKAEGGRRGPRQVRATEEELTSGRKSV